MYDEPNETPAEQPGDPKQRAKEKADEFRAHAQFAAVFEGPRKFDAQLIAGLDAEIAREVQRGMAQLEKAKPAESPVIPEESAAFAAALLVLPTARGLSTGDYHIYRRPGEVMMIRWLSGEQVETFYQRLQAHFDAAMEGYKEDERQANEWKQDEATQQYLAALDAIKIRMADTYLRQIIRAHKVFVLSTHAADELNIRYLTEHVMGVTAADLVGSASAPPADPTEQDLAWFYKLFALRGINEQNVEQMCFFTYLQKTDESGW
jgi:hypothetical protein